MSEENITTLSGLANGTQSLPASGQTDQKSAVTAAPDITNPVGALEAQLVDGQKTVQNPADKQAYDPEWWKKDSRYGKMWKSEQDIIKSYFEADKSIESKFKPAYKEFEGLRKKLKDAGVEVEKIDDYIQEYKSLKDPQNPMMMRANYFSEWVDSPLHRDKVVQFFQDLENAEMERKYPNMTAEARQKMIDLEARVSEFEKATKQQQQEKMVAEYSKTISDNLKEISKFSDEKGFEFTDTIKDEFLDHCAKSGVQPSMMVAEFIRKYNGNIEKSWENRVKSRLLEEQAKNDKTKVVYNRPKIAQEPQKKGFGDRLYEVMSPKK